MKLATNTIARKGFCLGCGLCESIHGKDNVEMQLNFQGFFLPIEKGIISKDKKRIISRICPSININNDIKFSEREKIWGKIDKCFSGFSCDSDIRNSASSGGIVSHIAIYMLENNIVDGVLQVGSSMLDYRSNKLQISKSKEDVLACAKSRYAPANIFSEIVHIFEKNEDKYCFIGKPCDISAMKNLLNEYPHLKNRIIFFVSIICAGMPSYQATEKVIKSFDNVVPPIQNLVYRGNGWPGYFSFNDKNEKFYQMSYNDSWGKILGRNIHYRCKICPDGIGIQADIAIGDAWETKDGYPDFSEKEGRSLILPRTKTGSELVAKMQIEKIISIKELDVQTIKKMQPYQYNRRKVVGARIIATTLMTFFLFKFKEMKIYKNLFDLPYGKILREVLGSMKRAVKL